jgi:hypothetical protein
MGWVVNFLEKLGLVELNVNGDQGNSIHLNDLQEWVVLKEEELVIKNNLKEELLNYVNKLKDSRWALECKIDDWEKKIHALGIDYRAQDINVIFTETRSFLENILFEDIPDLEKIKVINAIIITELNKLQQKISASSFSYNYSFILARDEKDLAINPLLKKVLDIAQIKKQFDEKIINSGFDKIKPLKEKVSELEKYQESVKQTRIELKVKKDRLGTAITKQKEKEEELNLIKEDPKNVQLIIDKRKSEEFQVKKGELSDQVIIFFSNIRPALKDYLLKNPHVNLARDYLDNPAETLFNDEGLAVLSLLKTLKEQVIVGKLNLHTEENNVLMQQVELAISGKLEELQEEYKYLLQQTEENVDVQINDKDFMLRLEEAKYRLEHFSKQVVKIKETVGGLEEQLQELLALQSKDLEMFKNLIQLTFNQEIEIRV